MRYVLRPSGSGVEPARAVPGSLANPAAPRDRVLARRRRPAAVGRAGSRSQTARLAPDGASGPPQTVSPPSEAPAGANDDISAVLDLAVDDRGNAVAAWFHELRRRRRPGVRHAPPHPHVDFTASRAPARAQCPESKNLQRRPAGASPRLARASEEATGTSGRRRTRATTMHPAGHGEPSTSRYTYGSS